MLAAGTLVRSGTTGNASLTNGEAGTSRLKAHLWSDEMIGKYSYSVRGRMGMRQEHGEESESVDTLCA